MLLSILVVLAAFPSPQDTEAPKTEGEWGGARITGVALTESQQELAGGPLAGVLFEQLNPGFYADRSGFLPGDLLLAVDGNPLGDDPAAALAEFLRLAATVQNGLVWRVRLLRPTLSFRGERDGEAVDDPAALLDDLPRELTAAPDGTVILLRGERGVERVELALRLGGRPASSSAPVPPDKEIYGGRRFKEHPLAGEIGKLVKQHNLEEPTADLRARLARLAKNADLSRLRAVDLVLRHPFALPGLAEAVAGGFEKKALGRDLVDCIEKACAHAAWTLDRENAYQRRAPGKKTRLKTGLSPEEHLDQLEELLGRAHALREEGLAALDDKERAAVAANWRRLDQRFGDDPYLFTDPDHARREANEELIRIGEQIDRAAMLAAAAALAPLADRAYLEGLAEDLEKGGIKLQAPIVLRRDTDWGTIAIGGRGDDWHRDQDLALLIELGGNDFYGNNQAASANEAEQLVFGISAIVDLAGDDDYEATHAGAQGCGILGVGLLVDLAGNDRYRGKRWAQGSALMGAGLLIDAAGDDDYRAEMLAQGTAAWGTGLLIDLGGDDRYATSRYGQGVGLAGGLGALADRGGDDHYYNKGRDKTGYGTRGVWEGWGQGSGIGFRANASGGFGLLLDEAGTDRYEAGNFSQGGGYYYGIGALCDRGKGDDIYIGSRYNQGFSAHQAVGYFHESGGDDIYITRNAVAHGLAWDECVTMFIEDGGDDRYQGGGFSLGASAHNAICVFWERRGDDRYQRGPFGHAGGNDYHGGTSLSVFVDEGRGKDSYAGSKDPNGSSSSAPEHGLFIDR